MHALGRWLAAGDQPRRQKALSRIHINVKLEPSICFIGTGSIICYSDLTSEPSRFISAGSRNRHKVGKSLSARVPHPAPSPGAQRVDSTRCVNTLLFNALFVVAPLGDQDGRSLASAPPTGTLAHRCARSVLHRCAPRSPLAAAGDRSRLSLLTHIALVYLLPATPITEHIPSSTCSAQWLDPSRVRARLWAPTRPLAGQQQASQTTAAAVAGGHPRRRQPQQQQQRQQQQQQQQRQQQKQCRASCTHSPRAPPTACRSPRRRSSTATSTSSPASCSKRRWRRPTATRRATASPCPSTATRSIT